MTRWTDKTNGSCESPGVLGSRDPSLITWVRVQNPGGLIFENVCDLVVVSNIFSFHPDPWGNDSQFDEHIFQMGWFNHQLVGDLVDIGGYTAELLT